MSTYTNRRLTTYTVAKNTPSTDPDNDTVAIETTDSTGFGITRANGELLPVGTTFQLETQRGSFITGICLNGEWLFRKSDEDLAAEHEKFVADLHAKRMADLTAHRDEWQAREDALPDWLKARLVNFHKKGGENFEYDGWAYELIVCEIADLIEDTMPILVDGEGDEKKWAEESPTVKAFCSEQGVSGNQFGFARQLVVAHRTEEDGDELIADSVSALFPITGDPYYENKK